MRSKRYRIHTLLAGLICLNALLCSFELIASEICDPASIELISTSQLGEAKTGKWLLPGAQDKDIESEISLPSDKCEQAQVLVQYFAVKPVEFVFENGFFRLMSLQNELGFPDLARETYRSWPWDFEGMAEHSPWKYIPGGELDQYSYLVLDLFSKDLPKRIGQCIYNPTSTFCDDGWGLEFVGSEFEAKFPESEHIDKVYAIESVYRAHLFQHNMHILSQNLRRADGKPLRIFAALKRASEIERFAEGQSKLQLKSLILKLARELKSQIEDDPSIARRMPDSFSEVDLDQVLLSH